MLRGSRLPPGSRATQSWAGIKMPKSESDAVHLKTQIAALEREVCELKKEHVELKAAQSDVLCRRSAVLLRHLKTHMGYDHFGKS